MATEMCDLCDAPAPSVAAARSSAQAQARVADPMLDLALRISESEGQRLTDVRSVVSQAADARLLGYGYCVNAGDVVYPGTACFSVCFP